ncbi:C-type lectin LmsL-like [Sceloporus undulatus]|uniref:C-type lectin LmsL-like n=1 Tax=Sceloporus undulatus TaxID=8520 RepID=UPI001C4AEA00|nr:C-type lectin LmsL-like [Sceloporus undulatus]XP_042332166.1 C-type lectin LmsL-like [Sceloporus undulatus]
MGLLAYASLCLFGLLLSSSFPRVEADSCAEDWVENHGNCYAYFDTNKSWVQAEIECQNYFPGAHLASVHSMSESVFIVQYISTNQKKPSDVWIGRRASFPTGKWSWSDKSVSNYATWVSCEPNIFCAALIQSTNLAEWHFRDCRSHQAYICKYELQPTSANMSSSPDLQI